MVFSFQNRNVAQIVTWPEEACADLCKAIVLSCKVKGQSVCIFVAPDNTVQHVGMHVEKHYPLHDLRMHLPAKAIQIMQYPLMLMGTFPWPLLQILTCWWQHQREFLYATADEGSQKMPRLENQCNVLARAWGILSWWKNQLTCWREIRHSR